MPLSYTKISQPLGGKSAAFRKRMKRIADFQNGKLEDGCLMPKQKLDPPVKKLQRLDPSIDQDVERLIELAIKPLLLEPKLRTELMPPGRYEWFEGFLKRSAFPHSLRRSSRCCAVKPVPQQ